MSYKKNKTLLSKIERCLDDAKYKADAAKHAERDLFFLIEEAGLDVTKLHTNAENADNLGDAISCYLSYGEYSSDDIMDELLFYLVDNERK